MIALSLIKWLVYLVFLPAQALNDQENNSERSVYIKREGRAYHLMRNGAKYIIKGVSGTEQLDLLKHTGGNFITVFHNQCTTELLDSAQSLQVSVGVIFEMGKPVFGHNYRDREFIRNQQGEIENFVRNFKDHPAILFWVIGNEVHLGRIINWRVWRSVNAISKSVHQIDPDRPTTTTIAGLGIPGLQTVQVKLFCPDIDFLSFNIFDSYHRVKREVRNFIWGWEGPYLITEFSPAPYWNLSTAEWGAIIEQPATYRAEKFRVFYSTLTSDTERCLGTCAFYWGEKQERTHTSFSLILGEAFKTQSVQSLSYCWTGIEPGIRCPEIIRSHILGHENRRDVYLEASKPFASVFDVQKFDQTALLYRWEILGEGAYQNMTVGRSETRPKRHSGGELESDSTRFTFMAPAETGAYRLFFYATDEYKNIASANIPFYVLKE